MKVVIVGCGRVGARLAETFDAAGHQVVILDRSTSSFSRLSSSFAGSAIRGDGTDEDVLRRAGVEAADLFLALTEGDNRNVVAAQVATEVLGVRRAIAKVNDPVRAEAYGELGVATICRTTLLADAVAGYVGLAVSGEPAIRESSGRHHHDVEAAPVEPGAASIEAGVGSGGVGSGAGGVGSGGVGSGAGGVDGSGAGPVGREG